MEIPIGIDLGTTYSAISTIDEFDKPKIINNSFDKQLTPSVIYFESNEKIIVGDEAKELQCFGEENIASFFKRNIGDTNFQLNFHNKIYNATDLSAILLKKILSDAENQLKCTIKKAVITVPAYFDDLQKKATIKAAEMAGIEVLRIINEPTAAALAYGLNNNKNQTILVYDLGGGTFDVTILKIENEELLVLATGGEHELGGKDFDNYLLNFIGDKFYNDTHINILDDSLLINELFVKAEYAKKQLSTLQKTIFTVVSGQHKISYEITKEKFEDIIENLIQKTFHKTDEVLNEACLTWEQIDGILLVGGSTRIPIIKDIINKKTNKPILKGINVDEAVCLGAAIQAKLLLNKLGLSNPFLLGGKKISKITDVISHSLGLIAENADSSKYINSIIIPKNKIIPSIEKRLFKLITNADKQNTLEIYLTQGESENISQCKIIGKYVFTNIEYINSGYSKIEIEYKYDENGVVHISAIQTETNKSLPIVIEDIPIDMSWIDISPHDLKSRLEHISVIIAIDLSGSMYGVPTEKAISAAINFVQNMDMTKTSVATMAFADNVTINCMLTQNTKLIINGINNWENIDVGPGNSTDPFNKVFEVFETIKSKKFLIVLTDGKWNNTNIAIKNAKKCADNGIDIIAIGFGSADLNFLKQIATSNENSLFTTIQNLESTFKNIAKVINENNNKLNFNF